MRSRLARYTNAVVDEFSLADGIGGSVQQAASKSGATGRLARQCIERRYNLSPPRDRGPYRCISGCHDRAPRVGIPTWGLDWFEAI